MPWFQFIPDFVQAATAAGSFVLAIVVYRRSRNKDD